MAKGSKPFVLNDENTVNSYGFKVSTDGIDLSRFEKNPVMLSDHNNSNSAVLGRWAEWKKENGQLTAYPDFDSDDEDAKKVERKVENDFIKGASIGILFKVEDLVFADDMVLLKRCELIEASIIPVPSNSNALRLYVEGKEDKPLSEKEVKEMCLSLQGTEPNFNNENEMKKIILSVGALVALGLENASAKDGIDEAVLEAKIMELSNSKKELATQVQNLTTANKALTDAQEAATLAATTELVDEAIKAGKITAEAKEQFLSLGKADLPLLKSTLGAIPAKTSLAGKTQPGGTAHEGVKTMEDFQKLSHAEQLSFKNENPDEYQKIITTIK
ncbi:hypothetical protein GCM10007424_23710 [Flavobacterium suaedae]|uniref:Prohead serine protease domain-containing protein n=1 Tax=Flavobacterium suaedae TaxID=1767027 RepID=A0ABQ1K3M8_9FLAO|nr:phage protease [Flavobacterium suaedae]GGB82943.1 hypothetical protein GCM10007424_23710 [Flavobacterium suaedae]